MSNIYYSQVNNSMYDNATCFIDEPSTIIYNSEPILQISGSDQFVFKENMSNTIINIKSEILNELMVKEINASSVDPVISEFIINASSIIHKYKLEQINMINLENNYRNEIDRTQKSINILESYLDISLKIESQYINSSDTKDNIDSILLNINNIVNNIKDNHSLKKAKKDYIDSRLKMLSYFEFVKFINKDNIGTTCSLCFANQVDSFIGPCGHTMCNSCKVTLDIKNYNNCIFCRQEIEFVKPLFYI
jgi:hypothetical protein